jgi:uncharacterized alpha-E superfamily protein
MKQLLTANVATSMYWLGRYLERIEGTLYEINKAYDSVIDVDKEAGKALYKKFDIEIEYENSREFLKEAISGKHSANLADIMKNARENAIISRANIDKSAFGEIIALNDLFQNIDNNPLDIDYNEIDNAISLINEIWGAHEKRGHRNASDYFLQLGQLIEEIDFRLRFGRSEEMNEIVIKEILAIFDILNPELEVTIVPNNIMGSLYEAIAKLIVEE